MALKTIQAGHARPRGVVLIDRSGAVEGPPGQGPDRGHAARAAGATTTATSPRAITAAGTSSSIASSTSSAASSTSTATVERLEYDPNRTRVHRADQVQRRRARLHPGAAAPGGRRQGRRRASASTSSPATRCRCATSRSARSSTTSRSSPASGGQLARSAGTFVQLVGKDQGFALLRLALGRGAPRARRVLGHDRRGVEPRPAEPVDRQGRPQPLDGLAPDRARHGDEPDRPSAWRRRRPHQGRPSSGHAVGPPTKGYKTRHNKRTDQYIVRRRNAK